VIQWTYLGTLLLALACMAVMDHRWRLVLWADVRRGVAVLLTGVVLFLAWDLLAVHLGFYRRGETGIMTGVQITPGVPLEEVFFILFLCYVTLVLHRLLHRFVFAPRADQSQRAGEAPR
jgi:lycopene cyclase domain-containing protein